MPNQACISGLASVQKDFQISTNNISNNSVTAFKASQCKFLNVVGGPIGGGVRTIQVNNISQQGSIQSTQNTTDMAINGQGFFPVSSGLKQGVLETFYFQRAGETIMDADGNAMTTSGHYRRAWALDGSGNITAADKTSVTNLVPMNFQNITGSVKPTTYMTMSINLNAKNTINTHDITTASIVDSLGNAHTLNFDWEKTGNGAWNLSITCPDVTAGDITQGPPTGAGATPPYNTVPLTFNGNGTPATFNGANSMPPLYINWGNGATSSTIALNLGTPNGSTGIQQVSQPTSMSSYSQDGQIFGINTGVTISPTGVVTAQFSNGTSKPIYQIPLATFSNPDGLTAQSGGIYSPSNASGPYILQAAKTGAAGSIESSCLEESTTDVPSELIKLVEAESAFFANAKGIEINNKLMEDLKRI